MKRHDWKHEIVPDIKKKYLPQFAAEGIVPTLRALHYRLYSLGVIYNTRSDYNTLSDRTARARESGYLDMDCFADDTREIIWDFPNETDYWQPISYVKSLIHTLKHIPDVYENLIPRWLDQPHHVEVWIEKKALIRTFQSIIGDRQVIIVPGGGYHSVSCLNDNCNRLSAFQDLGDGKKIHILYFGDLDPSGENIEEVIQDKLSEYGVYDVDFKRIGVTKEQIEELKLPTKPDPKSMKKLMDNKLTPRFIERHGKVFQVEVDVLPAKEPEKFKKMILDPIDKYFDNDIYKEVMNRHSNEYLNNLVDNRVIFNSGYEDEDDDDDDRDLSLFHPT